MMILPDMRFAVRSLVRRPTFTVVAVATIALAIAINTTIFSLVNQVVFESLPFERAEELVTLDVMSHHGFYVSTSIPNYYDWRDRNRSFSSFGASAGWRWTMTGRNEARELSGRYVLGDFFGTLGLRASAGRLFAAEETEPGAAAAVVLGHGFAEREFGSATGAIGETLTLDDTTFEVLGVLEPAVGFPAPDVEIYVPMGVNAPDLPWDDRDSSFGTRIVARLSPSVSLLMAAGDLDRVGREIRADVDDHAALPEVRSLREFFLGDVQRQARILMGAVLFVLLIACANVANLLLARGQDRRREVAVRTALGASRGSLIRQLLVESGLLAFAGGTAGLLLSFVGIRAMLGMIPGELPLGLSERIALDGTVLLFTAGLCLMTGLVFGLFPAWRSARIDLATEIKEGGSRGTDSRGRQRVRAGLVVAEIALSLVLLVGAGLLTRSLTRLSDVEKGFESSGRFTARITPPRADYPTRERWIALFDEVAGRVAALPGVERVAFTLLVPLADRSWERLILPEGVAWQFEDAHSVLFGVVSEDYFETLGVPLVAGRPFAPTDRAGSMPVTIIDETMAERFWPGEDPIGKRVALELEDGSTEENPLPIYRTVVGVAANVRHYELESASRIQAYVPMRQSGDSWGMALTLLLATDRDPLAYAGQVRQALADVDPNIPLSGVQTLDGYVDRELAGERTMSRLVGVFGTLALLLAAVGIFGLISITVARRTREVGIRMALGARSAQVTGLMTGYAMRLTLAGVAIGTVGALLASRALESVLFEVSARDPFTYASVAGLLVIVSLFGAWLPARRAGSLDPAAVLRDEG